MDKRYSYLSAACTLLLLLWSAVPSMAQTQLLDNFDRADNATVGGGWAEGGGLRGEILSNELYFPTGGSADREWVTQDITGFYNGVLNVNPCTITWAFNMRQSRSNPSGLDDNNYGAVFVLAASDQDLLSTGTTGYAVLLGNSGTADPIRLIRFSGLNANANYVDLLNDGGDYGTQHLAVRVTYDPSTDTWELFTASGGSFPDPLTAPVSAGTVVNSTYTGSSLPYVGALWNHATAGGDNARFDNFHITDCGANTMVAFAGTAATVNENGVSTTLFLTIDDEDAVDDTEVDVVLVSGDAARIGNYTTQTVNFPGGSSANQGLNITITDNGDCDGDEVLVFELQNVTGGQGTPFIGANNSFTLTIEDEELVTDVTIARQAFDGLASDDWAILAGAGDISTADGAGDTPSSERILSPASSWQVNNQNINLDLTTIDVTDYQDVVIRARVSSTSVSTGNGAEANDQVRFFVDLDGGGFPVTPDLTIAGQTNARWGFSTGTGLATTTAGTPATFAPTDGNQNQTTEGYSFVEIVIPGSTSTIALRVEGENNAANEIWNIEDIEVIGNQCRPVYYSRATGDHTDPIWSSTRTGTAGAATFDKATTMVIQNTHTVTTVGGSLEVRNMELEGGGELVIDNDDLFVFGTSLNITGTLDAGTSNVHLVGEEAKTITGTDSQTFHDLTVDAPDGVTVGIPFPGIWIRNELRLEDGLFAAGTERVRLLSDASGTARLAPVGAGVTYTGSMRVHRYIPGGVTNWRLLGSPVAGQEIYHWTDDFYTAGFPGSFYPNFFVDAELWPSVRSYDETDTGTELLDGLVGPTDSNDPLTVGKGFAAWSGDFLGGTSPFTVDVTGPPTIAIAPVTLPMSWTDTSTPAVDGWNLVSNPLPSPIDFGSVVLGSDVEEFYYIYDPVSGNNAAWDEVTQLSNPMGALNGNIQSSQGFWLKADGAAVTTTVSEAAKVYEPVDGGIFGGLVQDDRPRFRVRVQEEGNEMYDETLVHFITGAPEMGDRDVMKFAFSHPEAPLIGSRSSDGHDLAINAYGELVEEVSIPVHVQVPTAGSYTLSVFDVEALTGVSCLMLEDLETGMMVPVEEGATLMVELAPDAGDEPRFLVHATSPLQRNFTDVTCAGLADGSAEVILPEGLLADVTWSDEEGNVLLEQSGVQGTAVYDGLMAGGYMLEVDGETGCGSLTSSFVIEGPIALDVEATAFEASCDVASDGRVELDVTGGTAPFAYVWNNGSEEETLNDVAPGIHQVLVTDAQGCTYGPLAVVVEAGDGPQAGIMPSATEIMSGESIEFFNTSTWGAEYLWDFGDGSTSQDSEPIHVFELPGVYTVTLTATVGDCIAEAEVEVVVNVTTSVGELPAGLVEAWTDGYRFIIEVGSESTGALDIDVLDAGGRLVMSDRRTGNEDRILMPASGLPNGIYFLRVASAEGIRTFKLPLAR